MRQTYAYAASVALGVDAKWPVGGYQVGDYKYEKHPKAMKAAETILGLRVEKKLFGTKEICKLVDIRYYTLPGCKVFAYIGVLRPYCTNYIERIRAFQSNGTIDNVFVNTYIWVCFWGHRNYWESSTHQNKVGDVDIRADFRADLSRLVTELDALLPEVHKYYATTSYLMRAPSVTKSPFVAGCATALKRLAEDLVRSTQNWSLISSNRSQVKKTQIHPGRHSLEHGQPEIPPQHHHSTNLGFQ